MLDLSNTITKAKSIEDLNDVFASAVSVKLGWFGDRVEVEGYAGVVSTDCIAQKAISLSGDETVESKKLASYLAEKVFFPLKKLVESPENLCSPYQLVALTRIAWTPPQDARLGRSTALKHAMVLGCLDDSYRTW